MGAVLRVGAVYFALVFAVGFALGVIRTSWVLPAVGERAAELLEAPFMLFAVVAAARALVHRHRELNHRGQWLAAGALALVLLLAVEFTVVLWLRGLAIPEYFAARDPVAATVYYLLLGIFAVMPMLVFGRQLR